MAVKYHISKNSQKPAVCRAEKEPCRLGDHFENVDDAVAAIEASFSEEFGETPPTNKKKKREPKTITVYRDGNLAPPESHFEELQKIMDKADAIMPTGRQPRLGAVFASTNIGSMTRWIRGNSYHRGRDDNESIEFKVMDPDQIYVYPIEAWETYSWNSNSDTEKAKEYWNEGITLADFAKTEDFDNQLGQWEILIPKDKIDETSVKPVSHRRVLNNTKGEVHDRIHQHLNHRAQKNCEECKAYDAERQAEYK